MRKYGAFFQDIKDNFTSITTLYHDEIPLSSHAGPGHWNDPDMLEVGNGGMSVIEDQTHFSLWAMLAAPLLAGNDLRTMSATTKAILTNKDVIAIDQDPLGKAAQRINIQGTGEVLARPLANGDYAVLLFNGGTTTATITTTLSAIGITQAGSYSMHNLWTNTTSTTTDSISSSIAAHGVGLFRISSAGMPSLQPTPTFSLTPVPTVSQGQTTFHITICPHGLGNCGDNVSSSSGKNTAPLHTARAVTVTLTTTSAPVATVTGTVQYVPTSGNFQGTVGANNLPSGQYTVTVKMDGFLSKQIPGVITASQGQTITLPSVSLVNGDIVNVGQLDLTDYNILVSCYGTQVNTSLCPAQFRPSTLSPGADILDDDGQVDGGDYNEFLREVSVQKGG
ncbi:MAG TPA: hypothetical protein VGT05_04460 [Patescibacteria group bacterium]|nr:hypothetical protein [Patescibacteria group bacterium]